jgi:O-6-methylguanine DNA methyltransferase
MRYRLFHHVALKDGDALLIAGNGNAVWHVCLQTKGEHAPSDWVQDNTAYQSSIDWLEAYLHGKNPASLSLAIPKGTPFQQSCWSVIASIPYGHTISYTELASRAGNGAAIRAAASACGKNPLPLLIPCHRVVGKSGNLGGFAWGLPYKQRLLELEGL